MAQRAGILGARVAAARVLPCKALPHACPARSPTEPQRGSLSCFGTRRRAGAAGIDRCRLGTHNRDTVGRSCRHLPDHADSQCDVNFFTLIVMNAAAIAVAPDFK